MTYHKSEMHYNDYHWSASKPKTQVVKVAVFEPSNGNLILDLINRLTSNILDSKILEIIIHDYLPRSIQTINNAIEWLKEKGDMYYKAVIRSIVKDD